MPISPISVTFFFTVHSFDKYVELNLLNTRDRKKTSQQKQTFFFFNASLFLRVCYFIVPNKEAMARARRTKAHACNTNGAAPVA